MHNDDPGASVTRRDPARGGPGRGDRPWQRSLRWQAAPADRRIVATGLVAGILACVLQWLGFGLGMRPPPYEPDAGRDAVRVSIIEASEAFPIPPEPEPPPIERRASRVRVAPPDADIRPPAPRESADPDALRARIGSGSVRLFNPDGSIRLAQPPAGADEATRTPREQARARWADIERRGENPLDCRRTRFADAWAPDLTAGDALASKYLKYIGLADAEAIAQRAGKRAERAVQGCDPP